MQEISERHEIANRIADFIIEEGLTNPFGGEVNRTKRGKRVFYSILFSIPAVLDGVVEVWGRKFICVITQGPAELPPICFREDAEARTVEFIRLAFVDGRRDEAKEMYPIVLE